MSESDPVVISGAVEGIVDEAVLRRLVQHMGAKPGSVYGKNGKTHLQQRLAGYNQAARFSPWLVLVDLDHDADCAPPFRLAWLPNPAPYLCFRVAVREVEAWLLADQERLSTFLSITASRVPREPEAELDPKRAMVDLAKQARRREIREDMVPRPGSGRTVGPAYASRLIEFVSHPTAGWRPDVAAKRSDSLRRCLACLRKLIEGTI
jgi:hypothetical protein